MAASQSDLPPVNQSSLDRLEGLDAGWKTLRARTDEMLKDEIPSRNQRLFALGYGAIWNQGSKRLPGSLGPAACRISSFHNRHRRALRAGTGGLSA